jgi:putative exporter of polyketide antibiotics
MYKLYHKLNEYYSFYAFDDDAYFIYGSLIQTLRNNRLEDKQVRDIVVSIKNTREKQGYVFVDSVLVLIMVERYYGYKVKFGLTEESKNKGKALANLIAQRVPQNDFLLSMLASIANNINHLDSLIKIAIDQLKRLREEDIYPDIRNSLADLYLSLHLLND